MSEFCVRKHQQAVVDSLVLSDDEDEEEESAGAESGPSNAVKPEPSDGSTSGGKRKASSNELQLYSAEELSRLKKRELIADAELLDGLLPLSTCHARSYIDCFDGLQRN